MFSFRFSFSLSTLALLYVIIGSIEAAVVPPISCLESEPFDLGEKSASAEEVLDCYCVPFFLCEPQNVIVRSNTYDDSQQNQCPDTYVCCASPLPQENSTFPLDPNKGMEEITTIKGIIDPSSPIPLPAEPALLSNNSVPVNELSDDDEPKELECGCVALNECKTEDVIDLPTPRFGVEEKCPSGKVCCKPSILTPPQIAPPTDPCPPNNTKVTHLVYDDDQLEILHCQCVAFYDCTEEDTILLPTAYDDEEQCLGSDVCCKMSSHSTPPPIPQSTEPTQSNKTKIILYGVTDDDQFKQLECECKMFYLCPTEDIIDLSTTYTNDRCLDYEVCCKTPNSTLPTISEPEPPKVIIYDLSDGTEPKELECECKLFFQCPTENVIKLPTAYNKNDQCSTSEVCCKKSNSSLPPTPQPTEAGPILSNNTDVIIYGIEQNELKCECTWFYLCPAENIIKLPTNYNKKDHCEGPSHVCCRKTTLPSLPPPPVSQPSELQPPKKTKGGPVTLELSFKITWWP